MTLCVVGHYWIARSTHGQAATGWPRLLPPPIFPVLPVVRCRAMEGTFSGERAKELTEHVRWGKIQGNE
jgi:hypothetical protein